MDLGLTGKVALVAASSRGLGYAIAEELGNEGAHLILCSRNNDNIKKAQNEIASKIKSNVIAVDANLSDAKGIDKVVQAGLQAFGHIDILVTNTGGPPTGTFDSLSQQQWDNAVQQNLNSVLNLTRAVLPGMKERRWGRILNVTSVSVKQPIDNLIISNSIRAAVTGFARTLANEVATYGITVNNVLPGYTRTERVKQLAEQIASTNNISTDEALRTWETQIPMARIAAPREFSAIFAFLASERASYITGTSIPIDGGWIKSLF